MTTRGIRWNRLRLYVTTINLWVRHARDSRAEIEYLIMIETRISIAKMVLRCRRMNRGWLATLHNWTFATPDCFEDFPVWDNMRVQDQGVVRRRRHDAIRETVTAQYYLDMWRRRLIPYHSIFDNGDGMEVWKRPDALYIAGEAIPGIQHRLRHLLNVANSSIAM